MIMKQRKDEIREELESLSPFLAKMKEQEDGFEVPKNYFQSLPNQVFEKLGTEPSPLKIEQKSASGFWVNPLRFLFQPKYAFALASVALLLIASVFWINNTPEEGLLANLSDEEIESYIFNNIDEFDSELWMENDLGFDDLDLSNEEEEEYLDDLIEDMDVEDLL